MAKTYQLTRPRRAANVLMKALIRSGLKRGTSYLLTVPGRKTGKRYTTPVTLVESDGNRWLVAPYGEVSWVRNARAAGDVTLQQGRSRETCRISELEPEAGGPVLKQYAQAVSITRPYFNAGPNDPVEAFIAEADRHPVFSLDCRTT